MFCFDLKKTFIITITYLLLLLLLQFRLAKPDKQGPEYYYKTCRNLIYQYSANVLTIGRINSKILLITKNFYVYELSSDALEGKLRSTQMNIKSNAERMSKKWPILWNDKRFIAIKNKNKIYSSFTLTDFKNEYLYFGSKFSESEYPGVMYDIVGGEVRNGSMMMYEHYDHDKTMISSTEKSIVYAIGKDGKELVIESIALQLDSKFKSAKDKRRQYRICAAYEAGEATSDESANLDKLPPQIMFAERCEKSLSLLSWPVNRGFSDGEQFYLFAPQALLIFSMETFSSPHKPYRLVRKKYNHFFVCQFDRNLSEAQSLFDGIDFKTYKPKAEAANRNTQTHLILFALALLAFLICACCWCNQNKSKLATESLESHKKNNLDGSKSNKKKLKKGKRCTKSRNQNDRSSGSGSNIGLGKSVYAKRKKSLN